MKLKTSEHAEQSAVFQWAVYHLGRYPELEFMFAIPNGGHRHIAVARKLKAEGVKSGVPDIFLPGQRGGYAGLWIEMKIKGNKPTTNQLKYHAFLVAQGYCVFICYSADEAIKKILDYMNGYYTTP